LAAQRGNFDKLRKQPPELTQWIPTENKEGFSDEEDDEEEEEEEKEEEDDDGFVTVTAKKGAKNNRHDFHHPKKEEKKPGNNGLVEAKPAEELRQEGIVLERITEKEATATENKEGEESSDDEDDGQGWINPDNITKTLFKGTTKEDRIKEIGVTIMTADYAMQVKIDLLEKYLNLFLIERYHPNWSSFIVN